MVYNLRVGQVPQWLQNVRSKIHISFDIWSSRNGLAFLGIIAHSVNPAGQRVQHIFLFLKKMLEGHAGADIAEVMGAYLLNWEFRGEQLGVFVSDNARPSATAAVAILKIFDFWPYKIDLSNRTGRWTVHVITLAANAFIQAYMEGEWSYDESDEGENDVRVQ
jgi:hypothetical protein